MERSSGSKIASVACGMRYIWVAVLTAISVVLLQPGELRAQAELEKDGHDLYQFWCSTCHGDRGQGLTDEWRAIWPEDKQNCWQSKCHASNYPPDGFTFPKFVPAVIGESALERYATSLELYTYIQAAMPYWAPGSLSEEEYWAITAFLVETTYDMAELPAAAPRPHLSDDALPPTTAEVPPGDTPTSSRNILYFLIVCATLGLVAGGIRFWRHHSA
jgi:mono/diheme cytochrome c family protein